MKKRSILAAVTVAAALVAGTATPSGAATLQTKGTGWKLTTEFGVTSISPSKTYTVTYESEAVRKWYAPMIQRAVDQINAETDITVQIGGVEEVDPTKCGPAYHVQVMEMKNPMGADKPGWSRGLPCPNPEKGLGKGGLVLMNSNYRDGSWNISQTHLQNTAVHETLHALGLDHANTDLDKDGSAESFECVATSYGNKPVMCAPNGGYSTSANTGRLVHFDISGLNALVSNAKAQGLK